MPPCKTEKTSSKEVARKNRAAEIANTFEWVITAIILALFFRAFIMEAYRIPTGSMADTLKGAHFRLRCPQCGYRYDYGFVPEEYGLPPDTIPRGFLKLTSSRCPSCGHYQPTGGTMPIASGDRILVLKCIYQLFEPMQWDVIVFKNPLEPRINYIKRLVARPGETVEIIDGDIYINGQISRKPPKVQNKLWMPVYDNDYQPVRPRERSFNYHFWQRPFKNIAPQDALRRDSKWRLDKDSPTVLRLDSPSDQINWLVYDTSIGNNFRATYAYDHIREYEYMPYCSDLMVRFYSLSAEPEGRIGIELSKYQNHYKAWVNFTAVRRPAEGEMVIAKVKKGKEIVELAHKYIELPGINKSTLLKFANVDHQLIFQFGTEKLTYDLGRSPGDAGERATDIQPQVKIFGSGKLKLSHIAIFRDIHYTAAKSAYRPKPARATEGNPLTLAKDEFFVLGDNSPSSEDGRWWDKPGIGNNGLFYEPGIVPRDYLVGKALFVYWPSGFKPFAKSPFAFIPDVGQMRFIYGGSSR